MAKIIPFPGYDPENDNPEETETKQPAHRERGDDSDRFTDFDEFDDFDEEPEFPEEEARLPWEILGLGHDETNRLIDTDPREVEDLVLLEPRLTAEDAETVPVLRRVLALLRSIGEGKRATAKGYLPAALVKELFAGAYADAEVTTVRVSKEGDSPTLLFERAVAQEAGLITLAGKQFKISAPAAKALESGDYNEIYRRLLAAHLRRPELLEEFDYIDDAGLISATQFLLLQSSRYYRSEPIHEEDLATLLLRLFPEALAEIPFDFETPFESLCSAVSLRFFERFGVPFGLYEEIRGAPSRREGPWRRTALFDRVFRWGIPAPEAPPLTNGEASQLWLSFVSEAPGYLVERYARRAIERDPANGDAYGVWASIHQDEPEVALKIVDAGIPAASSVRSRAMLQAIKAGILVGLDRRGEAVEALQAGIDGDPTDGLGLRYRLFALLVAEGRLDDAQALQRRYPEESTPFLWNEVLLAYARGGAAEARHHLEKALEANRHVPEVFTNRRLRDQAPEEEYAPGSVEEAELYIMETELAWSSVRNIKQWLRNRRSDEKR